MDRNVSYSSPNFYYDLTGPLANGGVMLTVHCPSVDAVRPELIACSITSAQVHSCRAHPMQ